LPVTIIASRSDANSVYVMQIKITKTLLQLKSSRPISLEIDG